MAVKFWPRKKGPHDLAVDLCFLIGLDDRFHLQTLEGQEPRLAGIQHTTVYIEQAPLGRVTSR